MERWRSCPVSKEGVEVSVAIEMVVPDQGEHFSAVLVRCVGEGVGLRETEILAGCLFDGAGVVVRLGFSLWRSPRRCHRLSTR